MSKQCTECGIETKSFGENYWIEVNKRKGYRCSKCVAHREGWGREYDITHHPRHRDKLFEPKNLEEFHRERMKTNRYWFISRRMA